MIYLVKLLKPNLGFDNIQSHHYKICFTFIGKVNCKVVFIFHILSLDILSGMIKPRVKDRYGEYFKLSHVILGIS